MKKVNCIICNHENYVKLFSSKDRLLKVDDAEYQVVKCVECGLVFVNPQPTAEEIKKYYPADYSPYVPHQVFTESWTLNRIMDLKRYLAKEYPDVSGKLKKLKQSVLENSQRSASNVLSSQSENVSCLDFGCGNGRFMEKLEKEHPGWKITGLDNSPIACQEASRKGFRVYCGGAEEVGALKSSFDRVYMNSVIEHLHDPIKDLKIVNSVLKIGGMLRVMTPNVSSFGAKLFRQYWHALDTPRHLYLFNKDTLRAVLEQTGFKIKGIKFKEGMSVEIKSFYNLINRRDRRMNPIVWKLSVPVGKLLARYGRGSTIIVTTDKVRELGP